jgi:hypothetical protein
LGVGGGFGWGVAGVVGGFVAGFLAGGGGVGLVEREEAGGEWVVPGMWVRFARDAGAVSGVWDGAGESVEFGD